MPANNDENRDPSDEAETFQGAQALSSSSNYDMVAPRFQDQDAPGPLMTREFSTSDLFLKRGISNILNENANENSVNDPLFFAGVKIAAELKRESSASKPVQLQREPSRTSERIKTPSNKRKINMEEKATPEPVRASKRPKQATSKKSTTNSNTRGMHLKERPDMHERARAGQEHWGKKVQDIRTEWQRKRMWEKDEHYSHQISMCTRRHVKSQHECFLRIFQMSKIEGVIKNCEFSSDEEQSFCGWVSFKVNQETGRTFRERIANMFPGQSLGNTLNTAFRRAGLIPEASADETKPRSWEDAWNGVVAFKFHGDKRATYS